MHADVLLTIAGMGAITYGTRAGGLWILGRVGQTSRLEAWLRHLPGSILIALIAPAAVLHGPAIAISAVAAAAVAIRTRNVLMTMVTGIVAVVVLRAVM